MLDYLVTFLICGLFNLWFILQYENRGWFIIKANCFILAIFYFYKNFHFYLAVLDQFHSTLINYAMFE